MEYVTVSPKELEEGLKILSAMNQDYEGVQFLLHKCNQLKQIGANCEVRIYQDLSAEVVLIKDGSTIN
jgi:hypothetical protein